MRIIGIIIFIFFLTGCTQQTMYHSYYHVPQDKNWTNTDTVSLDIHITDTLKPYQLYFLIRNNTNYPYQNFRAAVSYNLPDTTVCTTDTLEIMLATQDGKWLGSGWAGLYQSTLLLKEVYITHPGNFTFKINHLLDEGIKGIADVGIQAKSPE